MKRRVTHMDSFTLLRISDMDRNGLLTAFAILLLAVIAFKVYEIKPWRAFGVGGYIGVQAKIKSVDYAQYAIVTINDEGNTIVWNKAAEKKTGFPESERLGKAFLSLIPKGFQAIYTDALADCARISGVVIEINLQHKTGREFPVEFRVYQWSENGHTFYTHTFRDLTQQRTREATDARMLDFYSDCERVAQIGFWEWDIKTGECLLTENMMNIFQADKPVQTVEYLMERVYHVDAPRVSKQLNQALTDMQDYSIEYRVVKRNNKTFWVRAGGVMVKRTNGTLEKVKGFIQCIDKPTGSYDGMA